MAFNINAHVILSGPKNIKAVTKKIQSQLGSVSTSINLKIPKNISKQMTSFNKGLANLNRNMSALQTSAATANAHLSGLGTGFKNLNASSTAMSKSQSKVQKSLQQTGKHVAEARSEIQAFGKDAALAIRRFSAFTVATGVVFGFVRAVQSATKAAIDYEREITKVVQVTGAGRDSIGKLKATIDDLSNSLGVDANELAGLSRTFAQTGQSIDQVRASIKAVARSSLAPSFGEMKNTAEGLIAALAQFNIAASDSEAILSSINAVSKKFAVEAEDLISVIRRAGGVFSQAAGNFDDPKKSLNELIGIFTAVRSTTRESADTIAVGLRTIFTRIQRRGTIDFLKQFNIELQDAQGNFVGLFPAFQKLSAGLGEIIRKGDALTLSAITEELGGVRQVGKLIPAITQFNKALEATKIAGEAAKEGLGKDVSLALQPLGKQFEQLQKRFMTLVRTISESKTFQNLAKVALSIGNAFLSVAETLKPLIPLMTTFAAIKISKGLFEFGKGFIGGFSKGGGAAGAGETLGGGISGGAARERRVADTGAQQALTIAVKSNTVALGNNTTALGGVTSALQGMRNTIANTTTQMLGAVGNLINALNRGGFGGAPKFAKGGPVRGPSHAQGGVPAILEGGEYVIPKGYAQGGLAVKRLDSSQFAGLFAKPVGGSDRASTISTPLTKGEEGKEILAAIGSPKSFFIGNTDEKRFEESAAQKLRNAINQILRDLGATDGAKGIGQVDADAEGKRLLEAIGVSDIAGKVFEGVVRAATGSIPDKAPKGKKISSTDTFDIPKGTAAKGLGANSIFANLFNEGAALADIDYDAKLSESYANRASLLRKALSANLPSENLDLVSFNNNNSTEDLIRVYRSVKGKKGPARQAAGTNLLERFSELKLALGRIEGLLDGDTEKVVRKRINTINRKITDTGVTEVRNFASGGPVFRPRGTDTVPAMLTPGEFVVNKDSAQKIGYGNLGKMNHLAKGGVASKGNIMQYFTAGNTAGWRESGRPDPPDPSGNWWQIFIDAINAAGETLDVWDKKIQDSAIAATEKLNSVATAAASAAAGMAGGVASGAAGMASSVGTTIMSDGSAMLGGAADLLSGAAERLDGFVDGWKKFFSDEPAAGSRDLRDPDDIPKGFGSHFADAGNLSMLDAAELTASSWDAAQEAAAKEMDNYVAVMSDSSATMEDQQKAIVELAKAQEAEIHASNNLAAVNEALAKQREAQAAGKELREETRNFDLAKQDAEFLGADTSRTGVQSAAATAASLDNEIKAAMDTLQTRAMRAEETEAEAAAETLTGRSLGGRRGQDTMMLNAAERELAAAMEAKESFLRDTPEGFLHVATEKLTKARDKATSAALEAADATSTAVMHTGLGATAAGFTPEAPGAGGGGAPGAAAGAGDLVGGLGSAVAAVSGFTVAFSSFDAEQPLASIMSLGWAASEAKEAMSGLGPVLKSFGMGLDPDSAAGKAMDMFGKEIDGVKGAPKKFADALGRGVSKFRDAAKAVDASGKKLMSPMKAFRFGLGKSKSALLKSFNVNSLKGLLGKGMTGIPGLVTSLIAGPIVGAISGAIADSVFGKVKKIEGTNIEGRAGGSGGTAGMLDAAGGAVGSGLAAAATAAMIPGLQPLAPVIGVAVAGFQLFAGAMKGAAKQLEFNAYIQLGKAVKTAGETLDKFNQLSSITPQAMANLNKSLTEVRTRFDKSFTASFARERTDQAFTFSGMFGKGGAMQEMAGGGTGGRAAGAVGATVGGAAAGGAIGAGLGAGITAITGGLGVPLVPILATIGAVIGGLTGLGVALLSTDKRAEATGKAFDKAAKQITPEFLEQIDKAFANSVDSMMANLEHLDPSAVSDFASMETGSSTLNAAEEARNLDNSWKTMTSTLEKADVALGGTNEKTSQWTKELTRLMQMKVEMNLADAIRTEAEFMDEEAANQMKGVFGTLKAGIDFGSTPAQMAAGFEKMKTALAEQANLPHEVRASTLKLIEAEKKQMVETYKLSAIQSEAARAAREAQAAFDALAAGLQNFASTTQGISEQLGTFVGEMKSEFDNLFSDSIQMDKVQDFNPFSNIDASSRSQIRGGIDQIRSFGGPGKEGEPDPFKGMEGLIKGAKELPFAARDAMDTLIDEAGPGNAIEATEDDVLKAIKKGLSDRGIEGDELPPQMLEGLKDSLRASMDRQGESGVFSAGVLEDVLGEQGDVVQALVAISEEGRAAMETAFQASQDYRNALLNVASLQQEMVEKERDMKLSMLDKEADIRDRVNKIVGRTPDAMESALSDLGGRMQAMTAEVSGVDGMRTGVGAVGNVFDVDQLMGQRGKLETERARLRKDLGVQPGQIFDASTANVTSDAEKKSAQQLGLVNAQLNGNTAALKELANDTRMLAAVEQQVADLQKKAIAAEQGAMGLAEARIAVSEGEMTVADYEKNFGNIIRALQKMSKGEAVAAGTMIDVMKKYQSGDPMVVAFIDKRIEEETRQRQAAGENITFGEVRQEKINSANMQAQARASATGIGGAGTDEFQRDMFTDSLAFQGQAKAKGGQLQSIADQQQKAQVALFDSQKKGFEKIFDDANQGLEVAVSRFQEAVDDFRELRGLAVSTEKASNKVVQDEKKVADLKNQLKNDKLDPKQRKALELQLADAKQSLADSRIALKGAQKKQKKQLDSSERKATTASRAAESAKDEEKRLKEKKLTQEKARGAAGVIANKALHEGTSGEQTLVSEDYLQELSNELGMTGLGDVSGTLGVDQSTSLGQSLWDSEANNLKISDMTDPAQVKAMNDLFDNFAGQLLGAGTAEAEQLASEMKAIRDQVGTTGSLSGAIDLQTQLQKLLQDKTMKLGTGEQVTDTQLRAAKEKTAREQEKSKQATEAHATMERGVKADKEKVEEKLSGKAAPATPEPAQQGSAADVAQAGQNLNQAANNLNNAAATQEGAAATQENAAATQDQQAPAAATAANDLANAAQTQQGAAEQAAQPPTPPAAPTPPVDDEAKARGDAPKPAGRPGFVQTDEQNRTDLAKRKAEAEAKYQTAVDKAKADHKPTTTEDLKDIANAKAPLNVDTAEMGTKDTQSTLNAFRAAGMKSSNPNIRKGAGSLFMGDAAGGRSKKTREERVADNIAKGEAKLKKLKGRGAESSDTYRKQQERLENMKGLQGDIFERKTGLDRYWQDDKKMPGDGTELPPGVTDPAAAGVAGQETLAATGQTPPTTERDQQQGPQPQRPQPQGPQAPGAPPAQVGEALSKGAVELSAALVNSAPEMAAGFVEGVKGNMEGVGKIIADEMKANLAGTDITITAKMGPITVQLTDGGGALQKMEKGFIANLTDTIGSAFDSVFNTDGSQKSKDTSAWNIG